MKQKNIITFVAILILLSFAYFLFQVRQDVQPQSKSSTFQVFLQSLEFGVPDYMMISRADLMALPTSGSAWDTVKSKADASATPDLCNQDNKADVNALAAGIVYARTGDSAYRTKAVNLINAAMASQRDGCNNAVLAMGRQLGGYVLAADFAGYRDPAFLAWLETIVDKNIGGHGRWNKIRWTAYDSSNNWGTFAMTSTLAADIFLNKTANIEKDWQVFSAYGVPHGWPFTKTSAFQENWSCVPSDSSGYLPISINIPCVRDGINLDGAPVTDASRATFPEYSPYMQEATQGFVVMAQLFNRAGFDGWGVNDRQVCREAKFAERSNIINVHNVGYYIAHMANHFCGLNIPTKTPTSGGRMFGFTDWLYSGPSVPVTPVTSTSTRTPAPATLTGIPLTSSVTPTRTNTPIIPTPLSGAIQFAVIGDFGNGSANETLVANLVKSWTPDFIITTGDNNYDSGAASTIDKNIGRDYHEFIGNYVGTYGAGSPTNRFWPSLGNHDWGTAGAVPHLNYFTLPGNERYYDFVQGDVHFFVVDSDSHEPDGVSQTSTQALWLKNALANSTSTWNVVYMHHPPYSSGSNHGSSVGMRWPFKLWGADVVMAGHDHTYERIIVDGMPYFVNGLGGRSIYNFSTPIAGSAIRYNSNYGAMLVEANSDAMSFRFVNINGVMIDSYSISSVPITPAPVTPSATPLPVTPTRTTTRTPTRTPTVTPTRTPTVTASPTYTPTMTITPTNTVPPPGSLTCVFVTWTRGLNMRPTASMDNAPYPYLYFGYGANFPVQRIFVDEKENQWMQINEHIYAAMYLAPIPPATVGKIYAIEAECP